MNSNRVLTPFVVTGNPDTVNVAPGPPASLMNGDSFIRRGELGAQYDCNRNGRGWKYQLVQLDSGATASTTIGLVAANQLAYWKDKSNYIVTNDYRFSEAGDGGATAAYANFVAGVFRTSVTAGNACFVLQVGYNVPVKSTSGLNAVGQIVVANTSTPAADVTTTTGVGTAPSYRSLGVCHVPNSNNIAYVDLDIGTID